MKAIARAATTLLGVASLLFTSSAMARPPTNAAARDLFARALELMKQEQYAEACPKLAEAQRLDPNVGYVVNLARCEAKSGHLLAAQQRWAQAVALARSRHDGRLAEVERGLRALEKQIPKLILEPPSPEIEGLVVTVDDREEAATAGAPIAVDPGKHHVFAGARGRAGWETLITMPADGATLTLAIPALLPVQESRVAPLPEKEAPKETPAAYSNASAPTQLPTPAPGRSSVQRVSGLVVVGAGVLALGAGTYFGVRAISKNNESASYCTENHCRASEGVTLRSDAISSGNVSTVALISGAVAVTGGLILWATAPTSTPYSAARVEARVSPTLGGGSFALQGTW